LLRDKLAAMTTKSLRLHNFDQHFDKWWLV